MHVDTNRLELRGLDAELARRLTGPERPSSGWADDFPARKDVGIARLVLEGVVAVPTETAPWGSFVVVVRDEVQAIGTIGFKGAPDRAGVVEVGYGISPSHWGYGLATEALIALVELAYERGAEAVVAETDATNVASQRVLAKAGFTHVADRDELLLWRHAAVEGPGT